MNSIKYIDHSNMETNTWDKKKITTGKNLAAKPLKTQAAASDGIVCCTY